jgi:small subunit ribosomal protein S17
VAEEATEEPAAAEEAAEDAPAAAEGEEAPAEEQPAAEAVAPPAKKKRKRIPRSERRQRPKPKREQTGERKPITRLPKPEGERGRRQERRGVVVSAAMDKTIVVRVDVVKAHPRYKKVVRRSQKFHAHDEQNEAKAGDVVRIVETKPLSKTKNWRLAEVVEVAR